MTDRSEDRVSVHESERVAARDYVEVHDYHETNTTNISAPGSTIVVAPPQPPRRSHRSNLGNCKDCHAEISNYAAECPYCGFNPVIEAQKKQDEAQGALLVFGLSCVVASVLVYHLTEWLGLFAGSRMQASLFGGVFIVMGVVLWWMWPTRPRGS